jgi:hypothetical protein
MCSPNIFSQASSRKSTALAHIQSHMAELLGQFWRRHYLMEVRLASRLAQQQLYSDSTGPDYTYTPGGRLQSRTWARTGTGGNRIVTTYTYGLDGSIPNAHGSTLGTLGVGGKTSADREDRREIRLSQIPRDQEV